MDVRIAPPLWKEPHRLMLLMRLFPWYTLVEMKNIIEKIKALNFPKDQYVVIGSGTMAALGIREANDVDISALPSLYETLFQNEEWNRENHNGCILLKKDGIEVATGLLWNTYPLSTQEAIDSAITIEGIHFLNLEHLVKFKQAIGREKDFKDIELIKAHIDTVARS